MEEWKFRSDNSNRLFSEALKYMPEGRNSGLRGTYPLIMKKGVGSRIFDVDGNSFIDYVLAAGPLILGHCHPRIVEAIKIQSELGIQLWAESELSIEVAKKVTEIVPGIEKLRFVNTGTEATMHAIRLARAYTGRDKILRFEGQYHGTHDYALVSAYPGKLAGLERSPNVIPNSSGITSGTINDVIVASWNRIDLLEKAIKDHKNELAAVITSPVVASMGVVLPREGYLNAIRELTEQNDIVLIFDEIVTGFRLALGGGAELYGVTPDLSAVGKALGGGAPIAAVGGRADIMDLAAPGGVVVAGTFNGNSLSLASAKATIQQLETGALDRIREMGEKLVKGLRDHIEDMKIKAIVQGFGSVFQVMFTDLMKVENYRDFLKVQEIPYQTFAKEMVNQGQWINNYGVHWFVSSAHSKEDIENTIEAAGKSFKLVKGID
nr:aspartate aminotransferase family protein [Candidatus Njordarchaeum guaymaensis]